MKVHPYLIYPGQAREAMEFYAQVLHGQVTAMHTHGEMGEMGHTGPEMRDQIMHARIEAGDVVLMASDAPPEMYHKPQGISVSLHCDQVEEAERVYAALSEGGEVAMPLQQTFWASRFAMFRDRFDIPWMINCETPAEA